MSETKEERHMSEGMRTTWDQVARTIQKLRAEAERQHTEERERASARAAKRYRERGKGD